MDWENILSSVERLGGTASGVLGALNGTSPTPRQTATTTPATTPAAATTKPPWLWIGIGGGVLVLLLVVFGMRRR